MNRITLPHTFQVPANGLGKRIDDARVQNVLWVRVIDLWTQIIRNRYSFFSPFYSSEGAGRGYGAVSSHRLVVAPSIL